LTPRNAATFEGGVWTTTTRQPPPALPLGLPPPKTPPPPLEDVRSREDEEDEEDDERGDGKPTRWWHEWLCGCGEGKDRGGDHQVRFCLLFFVGRGVDLLLVGWKDESFRVSYY
jgi:hypothetical protein